MKSNELRIGNWVVIGTLGKCKITIEAFRELSYFPEIINTIEPIPLTPEILEKAGFDIDIDGYFVIKKCLYWLDEGVLQISLGYAPIFNCPCSYVHQLQNIIFALTGEELLVEL